MDRIRKRINLNKLALTFKIITCITLLIFFSNGCSTVSMGVLHDAAIGKYPLLSTSIAQAPPQSQKYSRVVFYSPRSSLGGYNPVWGGGWTVLPLIIEGQDGVFQGDLFDQTGFYIDIPPGDYKITAKPTTKVDDKKIIHASFAASKIYFVKLEGEIGNFTSKKPVLVDNAEGAIKEIEKAKIRYYAPTGASELVSRLTLRPALIPNIKAASMWISSPLLQNKPEFAARVYILNRTFLMGGAQRPSVGLDCLPDIEVDKTKYICFEVVPGYHVFSVKVGLFTKGGMVPPMGFAVDLKEGEDLFIDYSPTKGFGFVSQQKSQELIKKQDKLAKDGYYRLRSLSKP